MTALSIPYPDNETFTGRKVKPAGQCRFCGRRLGLLRRLTNGRFCDPTHRTTWHAARLARVLGESERPVSTRVLTTYRRTTLTSPALSLES